MAKHIAMSEANDIGHDVRTYVVRCEEALRHLATEKAEDLQPAMLEQIADYQRRIKHFEAKKSAPKPKHEIVKLLNSHN